MLWTEWAETFPSSREVSADAYQRLIFRHHPWLAEIEPRLTDLTWVAGADSKEHG